MVANVLLYERPYTKAFFRRLAEDTFDACNLVTISEYKGTSDIWLSTYLYDEGLDECCLCDNAVVDDVIARCRTLRIMDHGRAKRIVRRTWAGIDRIFASQRIDYVLSLSLDNYISDILFRIAELYDVAVYSFLGAFAQGYVRFTLRGERNRLGRNVSEEEVQRLYSKMSDMWYAPPSEALSFQRTRRDMRKWYVRRKAIESVYYPLMKMLTRDPDNARFNMLNLKGIRYGDLVSPKLETLFVRLDELTIDRSSTVYFPLHFCPEATSDYYLDRPRQCGGYIDYIVDILENSDSGIMFLFKEHPSMYGQRVLSDYERILEYPNARIIHPQENSNSILEAIDTVAVDNGTVGVEALIRGKRVLGLDRSYYSDLHPNFHKVCYIDRDSVSLPIDSCDSADFLGVLLDGWVESDYEHSSDQSRYNSKPIAEAIRRMIESNYRLGRDDGSKLSL